MSVPGLGQDNEQKWLKEKERFSGENQETESKTEVWGMLCALKARVCMAIWNLDTMTVYVSLLCYC